MSRLNGIYHLSLDDNNGKAIESWKICIDPEETCGDEFDITKTGARLSLMNEIRKTVNQSEHDRKEKTK